MTTTRWRSALAALTGLLLAAPLLSSGPATARGDIIVLPSDDPCRTTIPTTCTIRVGSYNIEANRPMSEFQTAVNRFRGKFDVAGLQEIAGHVRINWLKAQFGENVGMYRAPNLGQIPIVWDTDEFLFVGGREHFLSEARDVEGKGGGLVYKKDTYAPVARLIHLDTLQPISVINVHLIQGAMNLGVPDPAKPLTHSVYVDQVASLVEAVAEERAAGFTPFVTGDFNISYAADKVAKIAEHPFAAFTATGMSSIWKGRTLSPHGTHIDTECRPGVKVCGAYIDGVWTESEHTVTEAKVFRKIVHSDHYPLMGRVALTVLPGLDRKSVV